MKTYKCWNCGGSIHSTESHLCSKCGWFVCSDCNSCGCEFFKERETKEDYEDRTGKYGEDYIYNEFDEREPI